MSEVANPPLIEQAGLRTTDDHLRISNEGLSQSVQFDRKDIHICTTLTPNHLNGNNSMIDNPVKTYSFKGQEQTPGQAPSQSAAAVTPDTPRLLRPKDPNDGPANRVNGNAIVSSVNEQELSPPRTPTRPSSKKSYSSPSSAPPKGGTSAWDPSKELNSLQRFRVVSLDRAQEVSDLEADTGPVTDDERRRRAKNSARNQISRNPVRSASAPKNFDYSSGADSSDGESSYFAKHLPSPKSGRRFSYSSNASAPARTNFFIKNVGSRDIGRESDASLSFSSDDDLPHTEAQESPRIPLKTVADMQLYPQRITRMHSVSSLVSSGSSDVVRKVQSENIENIDRQKAGLSPESTISSESSSDPSVSAELKTVAAGSRSQRSRQSHNEKPSGRRSPVLGQHVSSNPAGGYRGPVYSDAAAAAAAAASVGAPNALSKVSPPTILPGYTAPPGMLHPQPQLLKSEQIIAWMAAGNFAAQNGNSHHFSNQHGAIGQVHYGATGTASQQAGALPFVYSEDEEKSSMAMQQQFATAPHGRSASGSAPAPAPAANDKSMYQRRGGSQSSRDGGDFGGDSRMTVSGGPLNGTGGGGKGDNGGDGNDGAGTGAGAGGEGGNGDFKVYWQRWIMLFYMSVLNLLSDWTCYSVAPISIMTQETFGSVNPEQLVVIFLGANAVASACEPIVLARLGLRRTVIVGALLLMGGSIVKSGGVPPIIDSQLVKGESGWRLYLGFFLVGLSQPLYQCTPALLSASWFPESERTMATGVALNANQLGIGFAFIFGTILVADAEDIPSYFGLLSLISTIAFIGTLFQFDDAPPTPPSSSAKVMRGTLEYRVPSMSTIFRSVRSIGGQEPLPNNPQKNLKKKRSESSLNSNRSGRSGRSRSTTPNAETGAKGKATSSSSKQRDGNSRKSGRSSSGRKLQRKSPSPTQRGVARTSSGGSAKSASGSVKSTGSGGAKRRTSSSARQQTANTESGFRAIPGMAPSPAPWGESPVEGNSSVQQQLMIPHTLAPSPMMPGGVRAGVQGERESENSSLYDEAGYHFENQHTDPRGYHAEHVGHHEQPHQPHPGHPYPHPHPGQPQPGYPLPGYPQPGQPYMPYGAPPPPYNAFAPPPQYQQHAPPYWDPRTQQFMYYQPQPYFYGAPPHDPHYYSYQYGPPPNARDQPQGMLVDDGAEPVVTVTPHHLDINIRDDQVLLSMRTCFARAGFVHALVAFTVSGIVINTLSTFMDYLVRLNGAGREYVGIIGGSFQFIIMISSLIIGKYTDKSRAYYSVIVAMLVLGAFGLAECGVSLDANRGADLRISLIIVAALVGPLQPVSTELGVDVAYPLSENTVLVIQQLFSNLLSALFIPFFKSLKDIGKEVHDDEESERPEYTFSFYLLICLHAGATVFFATFNGRYLRYEHEQEKLQAEQKRERGSPTAFYPVGSNLLHYSNSESYDEVDHERQPLVSQPIVSQVV